MNVKIEIGTSDHRCWFARAIVSCIPIVHRSAEEWKRFMSDSVVTGVISGQWVRWGKCFLRSVHRWRGRSSLDAAVVACRRCTLAD